MATVRHRALLTLFCLSVIFSGTAAADANVDILDIEAPDFVESGDTARIAATVKNTDDEDAYHMEVKAEGFNQVKEENLWGLDPGEEDRVIFYLDTPTDREGTHEVTLSVQSRDRDGRVIGGEQRNVSIDVGESGTIVEPEEGDLRIKSVSMPATVMAGQTATVDVTVRNTGDRDMSQLHVAVDAFGRTMTEEVGRLDGTSTRTVPIELSVPAATRDRETIRIEASTFRDRDSMNATLVVSRVHATMNLRQSEVTVGDHVTVSGILSRRNTRADLYYGGRFEAPVFSDEGGHYTHTIIPERAGVHRVTLRVGTAEVEKFLTVEPELDISEVSVPERAGAGSIFDVCSRVSRSESGEVTLRLLVDGQLRKTETVSVARETEHCFSTSVSSSGDHTVRVEASAGAASASAERTVQTVDTGISTEVFPDQLTLTQGQAGVFQVRIDNDRLAARQFDISVDGFEDLSIQSPGTVNLRAGGSTTAVVRAVPDETGRYTGTITVSNKDTVLTEAQVEVLAVENPALKNPVIGGAAQWASDTRAQFTELGQREKWAVIGAGGIVLLLILLYWRRRRREVIEPQY